MPKPRTKRGAVREERKRKRRETNDANFEAKRRRHAEDDQEQAGHDHHTDGGPQEEHGGFLGGNGQAPVETEFFGMLSDEEQEYFRRADELLELNQFPSTEDRALFLESVLDEAKGKELKIASSQSCSRLMERLIQLCGTERRKQLFTAFAGHFLSLVQHRFASHCCEALFLRSAGAVSSELGSGFVIDLQKKGEKEQEPEASMESLFLETLDELEGHLSYLITDRFASHTLRVLLLVLSGRPLEDASIKSLVKSKKKENISVAGSAAADEVNQGLRAVPASFNMAVQKIISDSLSSLDATSLRVLAKHPIGNPTLQLLLELDLTLNRSEQTQTADKSSSQPTLLFQLLPGAPKSLSDEDSEASQFVNGMVYDQIGSRLVETLVTHAPGKIFKALNHNIFLPRIQGYVRNDISCYPAMRVLNRLSKEDLVTAVEKIEPTVPQLVEKSRFNVLKTLFERCVARGALDEIKKLNRGLKQGCGSHPSDLIKTLCLLNEDESEDKEEEEDKEKKKKKKPDASQLSRNEYAIQSHGASLLTTLLSIPGPAKGVQEAITALSPPLLLRLATTSVPTVTVLTTALATPAVNNPAFHKSLVSAVILPHVADLAVSQAGHNLLVALAEVPSKGKDRSVPFHMKEAVMDRLAAAEPRLRDCWMGRSVWRSWKGDMWKTRPRDWKAWIREVDAVAEADFKKSGANSAPVAQSRDKPEKNGREENKKKREVLVEEDQGEQQQQQTEEEQAVQGDEDVEMEDQQEETPEEKKARKEQRKKEKEEKRARKEMKREKKAKKRAEEEAEEADKA